MGFLDQYQADGSVPSDIRQQIKDAYAGLLDDYKRREAAGEHFTLTDLIAYEFLLQRSGLARSHPLPRPQTSAPRARAPARFRPVSGANQSAASVHSD